mgnify:CR=1 FL=1
MNNYIYYNHKLGIYGLVEDGEWKAAAFSWDYRGLQQLLYLISKYPITEVSSKPKDKIKYTKTEWLQKEFLEQLNRSKAATSVESEVTALVVSKVEE